MNGWPWPCRVGYQIIRRICHNGVFGRHELLIDNRENCPQQHMINCCYRQMNILHFFKLERQSWNDMEWCFAEKNHAIFSAWDLMLWSIVPNPASRVYRNAGSIMCMSCLMAIPKFNHQNPLTWNITSTVTKDIRVSVQITKCQYIHFQDSKEFNSVTDYVITFLIFYYMHDDVIKWKHFPCYWPFVRGIHRSPVNSPHKGQWHGSLIFSLICA